LERVDAVGVIDMVMREDDRRDLFLAYEFNPGLKLIKVNRFY